MVAFALAVYALWAQHRFTSDIFSRISSAVSQMFLVKSKDSAPEASGEVELTNSRPSIGSMKQGLVNDSERAVARLKHNSLRRPGILLRRGLHDPSDAIFLRAVSR